MSTQAKSEEVKGGCATRRDIRVDQVGLVNEVYDQWANPRIEAIKADCFVGERIEGDQFDGLLAPGGLTTSVDADKFVAAWESGAMTRAQFVSAVDIDAKRAAVILPEKKLLPMLSTKPRADSLKITRKKGVVVALIDAVRSVAREIDPPMTCS